MNYAKAILSFLLMTIVLNTAPMTEPNTVRVWGSEGENQTISVPIDILKKSPIIASMIEDVGADQAIPLTSPIKVIQDVVQALENPSIFRQQVNDYSSDDIIERLSFLHKYDINGDVFKLLQDEIRHRGVGIRGLVNNDLKKILFTDPAIAQLKDIMIQKQSTTDESQFIKLATPPKNGGINSFVFTPNGKRMFTGVQRGFGEPTNNMINVWSFGDDGKIERLDSNILTPLLIQSVSCLAINNNGSIMVAQTQETKGVYNVLIWQLDKNGNITADAKKLNHNQDNNNYIERIVFHPNGNMITAQKNLLYLWTYNGNGGFSEQPQILDAFDKILDMKIDSNGKAMLTAGDRRYNSDSSLFLWTFNDDGTINPKPQSLIPNDFDSYANIEFNKDGTMVIASIINLGIKKFSLKNLQIIEGKLIVKKTDGRPVMTVSDDFKKIAIIKSQGKGSSIGIYDTNGSPIIELFVPTMVRYVKFTPDGENLILSSRDGLFVRPLLKQFQKNLLADLSKTLTADQAQLIIKLSRVVAANGQELLSDAERKIYSELSPPVQALFQDNIRSVQE